MIKRKQLFGLAVLMAAMLVGCGADEPVDADLAVSKIPVEELQATSFLSLNEDKPGTPVTIENYLVPGKFTIIEFYSPFSEPNVNFNPGLQQLTQSRTDLAVRAININRPEVNSIDWQSPIVQEERIQTLPYFQIYDASGSLRANGRPAYEQTVQWLREQQQMAR